MGNRADAYFDREIRGRLNALKDHPDETREKLQLAITNVISFAGEQAAGYRDQGGSIAELQVELAQWHSDVPVIVSAYKNVAIPVVR
jgi:hypothetical protein